MARKINDREGSGGKAKVTVGDANALESAVDAPTKENDAFIEILESTGKDAKPEVIKKAVKSVIKKLPETLKV